MKKIKHIVIGILTILVLSCTYNIKFFQFVEPEKRPDITIRNEIGLIRTIYADIQILYLDEGTFSKLSSNKCFRLDKNEDKLSETQNEYQDINISKNIPLDFIPFFITITNRSMHSLLLTQTSIIYNNEYSSLKPSELEYKSYNDVDIEKILKKRRILNPDFNLQSNDFDKETSAYNFNSIQPSDSIVSVFLFKKIPTDINNFKIKLTYTCNNYIKTVSFDYKVLRFREDSKEYKNYIRHKKYIENSEEDIF